VIRYVTRRVALAVVVVAGVVVLTFVISDVVPGDPAASWAGPHASAAQIARARQYLGLDQPLAVRIGTYFAGIVTGNWGTSIHTHRPVLSDIGTAAPATLELVTAALVIAILVGVPLGLAAARWPGRALDHAIRVGSVLGVSMPVFWLALIFQLVFAQRLRLLPVAGQYDPNLVFSHPLTVRTQMAALPANLTSLTIAIAITWWPWYTRLVRGQAASAAGRPYVEACRALGIPSWRILLRHVLPNSVTPVIVQVSLDVGGVILTASALSFLGLGAQDPTPDWGLMVAEGQNYFTTQWWLVTFPGLAILLTALAFNLLGDGLRDVLDPRRVLIR